MTKRFALPDTLPDPYFTIDMAAAAVTVRTAALQSGRMMVEIFREGQPLCRVFAASVTLEPHHTENGLQASPSTSI